MNRLDLIIEALERANELWLTEPMGEKALAAARELKALKPVGMASQHITNGAALFDGVVLPEETLLYALDEVENV
jgi:hypothetical protein